VCSSDLVHRDIKPTNIMVDRIGQVKIIDFGVAKGATDPDLTQVGTSLGSPRYMAPEQFNPQGPIDWVRCDLYAVGMTLYYLLTRHLPFKGSNIYEVCDAKRSQDPPAPSLVNPAISAALDAVVMKAMSRDPEARHATAAEMRNELQGLDLTTRVASHSSQDDRTMILDTAGAKTSDVTMSIKPTTRRSPAPSDSTAASTPRKQTAEPKNRRPMFIVIGLIVVAMVVTGGIMKFGSSDEAPAPAIALLPPVLVEPATGSSLQDGRVAFAWLDKGDSLAVFTLQYATDPDFGEPVTEKEIIGGRSRLDRALSDGVYFWRVREGALAARDTMWSAARSFIVATPQLPVTENITNQTQATTTPNPPREEQPRPVLTGSALIGARIEGESVIADGALIVDGKRRDFHFPDTLVLSAGEHTIVAVYVYNGKEVTATRIITITNNERQTLILDFDTTD